MRSVPLPFLSKITLLWTRAREPGPVSPVKVDSSLPFPWTQRGEIYKKGETIREWFLYTRYREEIPKFFLGLYFVIVFLHAAVLIVWVIQHFVGPYPFFGHCMTVTLIVFDAVWMLLLRLMFWSRDGSMPYERWAPKKRGMRPKRRK